MAKSTKSRKSKPNKTTPVAAPTRREMMKLIRNGAVATIAVAGVGYFVLGLIRPMHQSMI